MSVVTTFYFLVISICVTVIVCEPHCLTPFHYHEQLLERMIEIKNKLDIYTEKMSAWEKVVSDKLTRFDEGLMVQQQFERKLTDMVVNHQLYVNSSLVEFSKSLKTLELAYRGSGSVYVRWGHNECPLTASLVYTGYTAGKHHGKKGSGTDNLCLPAHPTWSKYVDGNSAWGKAYIYGTEIDTEDKQEIFNYPVHQQDLPCAVCRSTKSISLMIPGRNNCYSGWNMEYKGYLMAGDHTNHAFGHICVDENPEFLQHGGTNDNEHILYLVEAQCGSLPCPPYVHGRELACVVCSI